MHAFFLSFVLTAVCVVLHYETLRLLNDRLASTNIISGRTKVLVALVGAMTSHVLQVVAFALAYYLLRDQVGLGGFGGVFENTLMSFFYFSSQTYTTLGYGDIYPTGQLRLICGIEALIGLLMISWTASFTYLEMRRYW